MSLTTVIPDHIVVRVGIKRENLPYRHTNTVFFWYFCLFFFFWGGGGGWEIQVMNVLNYMFAVVSLISSIVMDCTAKNIYDVVRIVIVRLISPIYVMLVVRIIAITGPKNLNGFRPDSIELVARTGSRTKLHVHGIV